MHHLEAVVLVQDVLGGAVVGGEAVAIAELGWNRIEVEVDGDGAEIGVDVEAFVAKAQLLVQMPGRCDSGPGGVDVGRDLVVRRDRPAESLEQAVEQAPVRAPDALRAQLDDIGDAVEYAEALHLVVQREDWRTESHLFYPVKFTAAQMRGVSPQ